MKRSILVLCAFLLLAVACRPAETAVEPTAVAVVAPTDEPPTATPATRDTPRPTATTQPTDTPTPLPTETATAKPTATPRPTRTPAPSATPRPTLVDLQLDTIEEIVVEGGYAFRPYTSFIHMERQDSQALFSDDAGVFLATLGGLEDANPGQTLDSMLDNLTRLFSETMPGKFQFGEPYPITVGGVEGLAADISGTLFDGPVLGRILTVRPFDGQIFYAFAVGNTAAGDAVWTEDGSARFDELLGTVRFVPIGSAENPATEATPPAASSDSACPVAVDATYGFTQENPIRVGGDAFGGPSRARAYFDTLAGPAGQTVTHQRIGSAPFGDTILDSYEVTYEGIAQPAILYVDQYSFETLYAPVGFTCKMAFPLGAP